MATAAGVRASGHDRRVWIPTAAAVAVLVFVFVLHSALSGQQSTEQQIGEQVYRENCLTKVSTNERVLRRWPRASKAEIIVCQTSENDEFANYVMDFAQFESAAELSAVLKTAPPDGSYCTIGNAVVTLDDLQDTFGAMCANRDGTLHEGVAGVRHVVSSSTTMCCDPAGRRSAQAKATAVPGWSRGGWAARRGPTERDGMGTVS